MRIIRYKNRVKDRCQLSFLSMQKRHSTKFNAFNVKNAKETRNRKIYLNTTKVINSKPIVSIIPNC